MKLKDIPALFLSRALPQVPRGWLAAPIAHFGRRADRATFQHGRAPARLAEGLGGAHMAASCHVCDSDCAFFFGMVGAQAIIDLPDLKGHSGFAGRKSVDSHGIRDRVRKRELSPLRGRS
jgi:hypothetical protein